MNRSNLIVVGAMALAITTITVVTAATLILQQLHSADAAVSKACRDVCGAPVTISGDNIYVAWWTNNTANKGEEVMFRASTDGGTTFGDKMNLSNTTNSDSHEVQIDSDAESVAVTWWETNQTSDTPVMRVSTDNGATFGPMLRLATNGTIGEAAAEEETEEE